MGSRRLTAWAMSRPLQQLLGPSFRKINNLNPKNNHYNSRNCINTNTYVPWCFEDTRVHFSLAGYIYNLATKPSFNRTPHSVIVIFFMLFIRSCHWVLSNGWSHEFWEKGLGRKSWALFESSRAYSEGISFYGCIVQKTATSTSTSTSTSTNDSVENRIQEISS
jgi:hypothetical protein